VKFATKRSAQKWTSYKMATQKRATQNGLRQSGCAIMTCIHWCTGSTGMVMEFFCF